MSLPARSSRRRVGWMGLALALLPASRAESPPPSTLEHIVDLSRGAPAELAADALIRIAALDQLPKKRRIELLEQAFQMAAASPALYKRRALVVPSRGPSGFLERVYAQDLDGLTLRLRAVEGLLALDSGKARERFEEIPPIQLPPLTCEDFLVYDVSRFYEVLGRVAGTGEEASKFLARYVGLIAHPAQVAPAARLLAGRVSLTDPQFQSAVTAFAGALSRISGDDRSFTFAAREAGKAVAALAGVGERHGLSSLVVLAAWRTFLANHLAAVRCEDSDAADSPNGPATLFNELVRTTTIPPLDDSESKPSKSEGKAKGLTWCDNSECRAIREQYRTVVFKDDGEAVAEAERGRIEWQARVRDFLSAMASWNTSSGVSAEEHFREKIGFYTDLLAIVPRSDTREYVLRSMLAFLLSNRPAGDGRLEWDLPVTQLVGRVALDPLGLGRAADDLRRADDPVIALEMALEQAAPRPVGEFMLLL